MSEATITCYCGSCELGLAEQAATCFFQCGCNSCRQKIQFGQVKGGREFVPLPKLFYMPSVITSIKEKSTFKLSNYGKTQIQHRFTVPSAGPSSVLIMSTIQTVSF